MSLVNSDGHNSGRSVGSASAGVDISLPYRFYQCGQESVKQGIVGQLSRSLNVECLTLVAQVRHGWASSGGGGGGGGGSGFRHLIPRPYQFRKLVFVLVTGFAQELARPDRGDDRGNNHQRPDEKRQFHRRPWLYPVVNGCARTKILRLNSVFLLKIRPDCDARISYRKWRGRDTTDDRALSRKFGTGPHYLLSAVTIKFARGRPPLWPLITVPRYEFRRLSAAIAATF